MRLTTVLLIASLLQLSAATKAQKVSIDRKETPLGVIIKELRAQTGYDFVYKEKLLKSSNPVTISAREIELKEALEQIFQGQPLRFEITDRTVIIKEKTPSFLDNLISHITAITIRGIVVDSLGSPLPGAIVRIKNSARSTSTDNEGKFSLNDVPDDAVIQISYIGYTTREIKAKPDLGSIMLSLANNKLDEVNVQYSTGYQTLPKERATGSFSYVSKEKLDSRISTNIIDKLDGLTSGLVFNKDANGNRKLAVRGKNTIGGNIQLSGGLAYSDITNSEPLIVLDNFPYSGSLDNINPNDVEDITILKDAAAASIWGARSGNGVIVITTKKGKKNQPLGIDFTANTTVREKPDLNYNRNYLESVDLISIQQELYNRGVYANLLSDPLNQYLPIPPAVEIMGSNMTTPQKATALEALRTIDVRDDLKKYFYRTGLNQQYNLAFHGGSERAIYSVSVGYDNNQDNIVGNSQGRWTMNANLSFNPVKNLEIGGVINFIQNTSQFNNALGEFVGGIGSYYPYSRLSNENGDALRVQRDYSSNFINNIIPGKGFLDWSYYPLNELRNSSNTGVSKVSDYRFAPVLKYNIAKGLSAILNYQYENQTLNNEGKLTTDAYQVRNLRNRYATVNNGIATSLNTIPEGGILDQASQHLTSKSGRVQLNYNNVWDKGALSILLGAEASEIITESNTGPRLYGYIADKGLTSSVLNYTQYYNLYPSGFGTVFQNIDFNKLINRNRSIFFNGAYTLKDKYTFSLSARSDAANIFGVKTNQKYVPLGSAGIKWDIDKEKFYKLDWLPMLKFRATYGFTGNLPGGVTAYTVTNNSTVIGSLGIPFRQQFISSYGNADLRWEKVMKTNLAVDFSTIGGRISGSIEYYDKRGRDMMGAKQLSDVTGTGGIVGNFADIKGNGYDISLNVKNIEGAFKWTSGYLFSYTTDKVTKYYDEGMGVPFALGNSQSTFIVGYPSDAIYSLRSAGLDPETGNPRGYISGQISSDYPKIISPGISFKQALSNGNWVFNGSGTPRYFGAFRNIFEYKNFTLAANISFKAGYYFRRQSIDYSMLYNGGLGNRDYSLRWQNPGDEARTKIPSFPLINNSARDVFFNNSEDLVEKGDHIRLQDINISYVFNRSSYRRLPVKSVKIFAYINNVGILWRRNKQGIDPDYSTYSNNITPNPRSYAIGVQTSF